MLWPIVITLILLWLLGAIAIPGTSSLIHLLLVVVLVIVIYQLLTGRRTP